MSYFNVSSFTTCNSLPNSKSNRDSAIIKSFTNTYLVFIVIIIVCFKNDLISINTNSIYLNLLEIHLLFTTPTLVFLSKRSVCNMNRQTPELHIIILQLKKLHSKTMESKRILLLFNNTNSKQNHDKQSSYQMQRKKVTKRNTHWRKTRVGDTVCWVQNYLLL